MRTAAVVVALSGVIAILWGRCAALGADAAAATSAAATTPGANGVDIQSDTADFDLLNQVFLHEGHVHVKETQMELWCDKLLAQLAGGSGKADPNAAAASAGDSKLKLTNIVATGSVVIEVMEEGSKSHATGAKAVYNAVTDQMELTGEPKLVNKYGTLTADRVILERTRRKLSARGNVRMILPPEVLKQPDLNPDTKRKEKASEPEKPKPAQ